VDIEKVLKDISEISFNGNIIPHTWYKHVVYDTDGGKTKADLLAINILADVVYWYRLSVIRDESTGQIIEYRKKFKGEKLQKSYNSYAEQFGSTKRAVKYSIDLLVKLNLVTRVFEDIKELGLFNVMYLVPASDRIREISEVESDKIVPSGGVLPNLVIPPTKNSKGSYQKPGYPLPKYDGDSTKKSDTNTKITSETKESFYLIVIGAEKDKKFTSAFNDFTARDDNKGRADTFYWISHNAEKYQSSLPDVISALEASTAKGKQGEIDYFTGVLRKKAEARTAGLSGYGKPEYWRVDEYLRDRLRAHIEDGYLVNYDLSIKDGMLYYSVREREDREPVADLLQIVSGEIEREFKVKVQPKVRV